MAKSRSKRQTSYPLDRFIQPAQLGGIQTALLDDGPSRGVRVAYVNTGGGLRYTVSLDRGADLVDAALNQHSLAFLSSSGMKPASHAYNVGQDWLVGWPGGLMTTCGPEHIGHPREEPDGTVTNLHGRHSNTPATVESIVNPDPRDNRMEMSIAARIFDTRMFGPNLEMHRTIRSTLGENTISLTDVTTNRHPQVVDHALMYHCNFGWPLLDAGARIVLNGEAELWPAEMQTAPVPKDVNDFKKVIAPTKAFAGNYRGMLCTPRPDSRGLNHIGLVNAKLGIAVELEFPAKELPQHLLWQNFDAGHYVLGMEPLVGTAWGKGKDPKAARTLRGGQSRTTHLTIRVHSAKAAVAAFLRHDGPLKEV
ncbi:MAG: DUF4432 domain-containing protein [Planctomycetaceae bacterium]|nr:DUF4432 domain-containing protein [Planctomycetaceae bacterium]